MNEQELADLFSEQIDRLLDGEAPDITPEVDDLQELLEISHQINQAEFQISSTAQAAFQSQLANWTGIVTNGGSPMTILGLSKVWFISIIVTTLVIITGGGFIALLITGIFIFNGDDDVVELPLTTTPATAIAGGTPEASVTTSPVATGTPELSTSPTAATSPTVSASGTPAASPTVESPTIIFVGGLPVVSLCQGVYTAQTTVVNHGHAPVTGAALGWEVIEGAELVDEVDINSPLLDDDDDGGSAIDDDTGQATTDDDTVAGPQQAGFSQIAVDQEVKLDLEVKVNNKWWQQADGTKIKIKLSIKNEIEITDDDDEGDRDRGHGNDPDGRDEDNPGRGHRDHNGGASQIITIVRQGSQWLTLTGPVHHHNNQTMLVNGISVTTNTCTFLPPTLPSGSNVNVIGIIQPNNIFMAIAIIVVDIDFITGDFDSGVPMPGGGNGGSGGDSYGGGNSGGGGSRGGGSRGGGSGGS